jgi:hypothetical protein
MKKPHRMTMKWALVFAGMLSAAPAMAADPVDVVQEQLNAYNAHDIRAFLTHYAPTAEVFEFPAKPLMKGTAQIEEFYGTKRFNDPRLHATVEKRIVMGNVVIDHEIIANTQPGGPGHVQAVAIYEVNDGKITKVTLIRGSATLDAK